MARRRKDPLAFYIDLVDYCNDSGYRTHLDIGRDGWTMDVFERGSLIARGVSRRKVPACFDECAAGVSAALSHSGKGRRR